MTKAEDLDGDGYPRPETLERVANWPIKSRADAVALLEHVRSLWAYPDYFTKGKDDKSYLVSTGGWSGNEDLIGALQRNYVFWSITWRSHRRGGHYEFDFALWGSE